MGGNSTEEKMFPTAEDFLAEIAVVEQVLLGICSACAVICWLLFAETIYYVWTRQPELKHITRCTAWILGLAPTLAVIALLAMFVPRIFIFRDVLAFIAISIVLEKFIVLLRAYYRTFEHVMEVVHAEQKLQFNVPPCMCCCVCIKPVEITRPTIDKLRWTVIQYPIITVLGSIVVMVTSLNGNYKPGKWARDNPYGYIEVTRLVTTFIVLHGMHVLVQPSFKYMRSFMLGPKYITTHLCALLFGVQGIIFDMLIGYTELFDFRDGIDKAPMGNFYKNVFFVIELTLISVVNRYTYRRTKSSPEVDQKTAANTAQQAEANRKMELELGGIGKVVHEGDNYIEKNLGQKQSMVVRGKDEERVIGYEEVRNYRL